MTSLDLALASRFARIALGHVEREYPNKLDHVLASEVDAKGPRALHPVFYGSFDWHSCVHGYWLLTHLYRRFPALPERDAIRAVLDRNLTPANVAIEVAYLARPSSTTFERPYGWAWLLELAADLTRHTSPEGKRWAETIAPLATAFARRFVSYLPKATYPVRSGAHGNTAFALALALDYARAASDAPLESSLCAAARKWYAHDTDCQAWEPSGDDFLSPALMEAECMRRVLPPNELAKWLDAFLPRLGRGEPKTLFAPATVSDRTDGKIAHLDGLNLSRAWCLRSLAGALDAADPRSALLRETAEAHLAASLPHVAGDYMGEHWLATFAVLALG